MSLRIIAGVYGSRVLKSVRGLGTRPLLGQVKAAIFNILGDQVVDRALGALGPPRGIRRVAPVAA